MILPTEESEEGVVWLGTGPARAAEPVREWLKANAVDCDVIPLNSTITVKHGQIHFTRLVRALDGRIRVTEQGEPAMEAAPAPLLVAWPLEQPA